MKETLIDISHWQNYPDFNKVKAAGINSVILKLGQYKSKDKEFETSYSKCTALGMNIGCYIYNYVTTVEQAKTEAEFAVKQLQGKKMACGVWLDLEDAKMKKLGKTLLNQIIATETSILVRAGFKVGIYSNMDWFKNILDSKTLVANGYKFWIARYPLNDNGTVKSSLDPKGLSPAVVMWQYSSKGKVPGIKGNVDMDLAYEPLATVMTGAKVSAQTVITQPQQTTTNNVLDYALVFNATYYYSLYADLRKAGINSPEKLLSHFKKYGMKEGRIASPSFNVHAYKAYYMDLQKAFGNNLAKYYEHYMKYGFKEGRKAI